MVKFEDLSERAQDVVDQFWLALSDPVKTNPDVILIGIPAGRERDDLVAYLALLTHAHNHKLSYLATTKDCVDRLCYDLGV